MPDKFSYSYDSLKRMSESPVSELGRKYVASRGAASIISPFKRAVKERDEGISIAFQHLESKRKGMSGKSPSEGEIKSILMHSETIMYNKNNSYYDFKTDGANPHKSQTGALLKGVGSGKHGLIRKYGEQYLKDNNLAMFLNRDMTAQIKGANGMSYGLQGSADIALENAKEKSLQLVKLQTNTNVSILETFDAASTDLQAKSLAFMAMQDSIQRGQDIQKVSIDMVTNTPYGTDFTSSYSFEKKQLLNDIETELSIAAAKSAAYDQLLYEKTKKSGNILDGFNDAFHEIIKNKGCNPGIGCKTCLMRYSCHIRYSADLGEKLLALQDGGTTNEAKRMEFDSETRQAYSQYQDARKYDVDHNSKIARLEYEEKMNFALEQFKKEQHATLGTSKLKSVKDIVTVSRSINDSLTVMRESVSASQKYIRGQFADSQVKNAIIGHEILPQSVLANPRSGNRHAWLNDNLHRTVKTLTYESVTDILKKLDIDRPLMTDRIVDNLFKDKKFVSAFDEKLQKNAVNEMYNRGMFPTLNNASEVHGDVVKMLDNDLLNHLMTGINQHTIDEVSKTNAGALRRQLPHDMEWSRTNNDAIFDHLKSKGITSDNPEMMSKRVAQMETAFASKERFRLSPPQNLLSTMAQAFVLAQLASNNTILNMINNKVEKVANIMASKEQGIDTGEHNSTYGSMRRLLLSDFGSSTRKFSKISDIYSYVAARGASVLKAAKDTAADYYLKGASSKYNPEHLTDTGNHFIYGGVAAAVGVGMYSIVPRSQTRGETKRYEQTKKKALKKYKEPQRSTDSDSQTPQSDLRSRYKIHTQFGSPLTLIEAGIQAIKAEEFVQKVSTGALALIRKAYTSSMTAVAKSLMLEERGKRLADPGKDAVNIIKDAAGKDLSAIEMETEQFITEAQKSAVSKSRTKEMYKSGRKKLDEWATKENRDKIIEKVMKPDMAISTLLSPAGSMKNRMPINPEYVQPGHEHVVAITSKSDRSVDPSVSIPGQTIKEQAIFESFSSSPKSMPVGNMIDARLHHDFTPNDTVSEAIIAAKAGKTSVPYFTMNTNKPAREFIESSQKIPGNPAAGVQVSGVGTAGGDKMAVYKAQKTLADSMNPRTGRGGARYPGREFYSRQNAVLMGGI